MSKTNLITFILAGGKGERLYPLTKDRTKPAVPFAGAYRIIDFTLSNCLNSGLRKIFILTQYKSISLHRHLRLAWNIFDPQLEEFIEVIPAQQRVGESWYKGTSDAIFQNLYTITQLNPQFILILAGDHIYKMDYRNMIEFHTKKDADLTVGVVKFPLAKSTQLGVLKIDTCQRIVDFVEKPQKIDSKFIDKNKVWSSMGIYIFKTQVLKKELEIDARNPKSTHDFGRDLIPQMLKRKRRIFAYKFSGYWEDIGTLEAFYQANMKLCRENPPLDIFDKKWPLRTYPGFIGPSKMVGERNINIRNSLVCGGALLKKCRIKNSIVSAGVCIEEGCIIEDSIIMEDVYIGKNSRIRKAIIDKHVRISSFTKIGYDKKDKRFFTTPSGVVIIERFKHVK